MRLNKFIADCGVCARRKADTLIQNGEIAVNGSTVSELGTKIDPVSDVVTYQGSVITPDKGFVYYLLYKPAGVMSTCDDPQGRKTVLDIIDTDARIYPVGRLDYETSGVLILTNDGALAHAAAHPSHAIEKEYVARVGGLISDADIDRLRSGVDIDGRRTHPARVERLEGTKKTTMLRFVIHEGRNRQIRKMVQAVGGRVIALTRTRLGGLTLDGLKPGEYRGLTPEEVAALKGETR